MPAEHFAAYRLIAALWILSGAAMLAQPAPDALPPVQAQALVERALANELRAAQDGAHPMRYVLHKASPRLTSTKEMIETKDGAVARLVAINDQPLNAANEQKEQARLDALLRDPGQQRHRKQAQDADFARAIKVLRVLPSAFLYEYAGPETGSAGTTEKFTFKPNPSFDAPDLETQVLTAMSGELWIDATSERVERLDGRLQQDVDFGWGILGRLYKGGWIKIEQANVCGDQWRTVRFQMSMSGRVFWRTRAFDTTEEQSQFAPVPVGLGYAQAIGMLRSDSAKVSPSP
ncbi:MAG TPA: hypothetical protein VFB43_17330 [Terracidiphilus sp.]|jgi:hypothetical protein|nr:hypothetical protein [Terracidiphilus sp.]